MSNLPTLSVVSNGQSATDQQHNSRRVLWLLMIAALLVNLALLTLYYVPMPKRLIGDEIYYFNLAATIANGQSTQHDPLWPPLYGELLGAIFSWTGVSILAVQIVQIALWLFVGILLFWIVEQLLGQTMVATTALGLYLFLPDLMTFSHYLWPETLHMFLMLTTLWLLICHQQRAWTAVAAGIALGLALLTKSLLLPLLPLLLLFVLIVNGEGVNLSRRVARAGLLAGGVLATTTLCLIAAPSSRGELSLAGSVIFNAWVGLNDSTRMDSQGVVVAQEYQRFVEAGPDLATRNATYRGKILELLQQQGLLQTLARQVRKQYFRLFDYHTFFATQLPDGPRTAYAFKAPLLATALRLYSALFYGLVLAAGALGMAFVRARPLSWLHFFLLFLLYNLAIFLVAHVTTRYVIQILPLWIVFAAVALSSGTTWLRDRQTLVLPGIVISRRRLAMGATLAVTILVLTFGSLLFHQ